MELEIVRTTLSSELPQVGMLMFDGVPECITLELPYLGNKKGVSCIPPGRYLCKKVKDRTTGGGMKIPLTFEVTDVPGRTGILFHKGNTTADTRGCVLIGKYINYPSILNSRDGWETFLKNTRSVNEFTLNVRRL